MAGPILYSTNPWISHDIAVKYRLGVHFAWVSDYYDASMAPPGTAAALIAPSSSPKVIYEALWNDVEKEDTHSALIKGYRKTFKRLANEWFADSSITKAQRDEIVATVDSRSWKIWRPVVYVIAKSHIVPATRIETVKHKDRAAYGPEMRINDLAISEFDIIEVRK
jgi:hypothetical protein